jgi:hypothetical protein
MIGLSKRGRFYARASSKVSYMDKKLFRFSSMILILSDHVVGRSNKRRGRRGSGGRGEMRGKKSLS